MNRKITAVSLLLLAFSPASSFGQQPGSVEYNTVFLPAHGAGDTRQPQSIRWGAIALGTGRKLGFAVNARSESSAKAAALKDCSAHGGTNCELRHTFFNACAVVAASPGKIRWVTNDIDSESIESLRRSALSDCGQDCKIVREACAVES